MQRLVWLAALTTLVFVALFLLAVEKLPVDPSTLLDWSAALIIAYGLWIVLLSANSYMHQHAPRHAIRLFAGAAYIPLGIGIVSGIPLWISIPVYGFFCLHLAGPRLRYDLALGSTGRHVWLTCFLPGAGTLLAIRLIAAGHPVYGALAWGIAIAAAICMVHPVEMFARFIRSSSMFARGVGTS